MSKKIFYGWWIVFACFLIGLYTSGIVFFGFTAFFEPLIAEFGWSYTQVSFAASLRGLEFGIFAPLIGFLIDRFGPRKVILLGVITVGFGLVLLSLTQSLVMFYGSFLLLSLGAGGCMGLVVMSVVADWFDKKAGKAFGVMSSAFGASGLIIPVIIYLIAAYHWRMALVILGLGAWILGIPLSFVIRDKPEHYGYLPDGALLQHPISPPKKEETKVEIDFKPALKQRAFSSLMVAEFLRYMVFSAVVTHVMPHLSNLGVPRSTAGVVAAAIPLVSIVGRIGFGWLGDIIDKRYVMVSALCLMGLGILSFCFVKEAGIILIFLLLFSPGVGGAQVSARSIQREYFGRRYFGKMLGLIMGSASIGGIIGPTAAGWVFDSLRNYNVAWLGSLGLVSLAIIMILRIEPRVNQVQGTS